MKSTIRNLSGSAVVLPPMFANLSLGAGQSVDEMYSNMPNSDLAQLVALAQVGTIDFPGNAGSGILAGLQVTPSLTYVVNGQEPANQPDGTVLYSVDDGDLREYSQKVWRTRGRDSWSSNPDDPVGRTFFGMTKLKDGRIMRVCGGDENGNPTAYCAIFDPSHATLGWVATAPFPGVQIPMFISACTLKNGKVLVVGGAPGAVLPLPDLIGPFNEDGGNTWLYNPKTNTWAATGNIPETLVTGEPMAVLNNGKGLKSGGGDISAVGVYGPISKKTYVYDPTPGTWALAAGLMAGGHAGVKISAIPGNKAYVVGGYEKFTPFLGGPAKYSNRLEFFDHATGLWTSGPDMPSIPGEDTDSIYGNPDADAAVVGSRGEHGHILVGRKIVVVGGDYSWNEDADWAGFSDVWGRHSIIVYDLDDAAWTISGVTLPTLVDSPYMYDLGNNRILIAGGYSYETGYPDYRCFIYNVEEDTIERAADLPNIPTDIPDVNTAIQDPFHYQEMCAISLSKDLHFYCGAFSFATFAYGGESALYSAGNKHCKGKKHGWAALSAPDKAKYLARNNARRTARRRRG